MSRVENNEEFFTEQMKPNWKGRWLGRVLAQIATQLHSLISTIPRFNASKFYIGIN